MPDLPTVAEREMPNDKHGLRPNNFDDAVPNCTALDVILSLPSGVVHVNSQDWLLARSKFSHWRHAGQYVILAEGAIALSVTLSGGVLFAS